MSLRVSMSNPPKLQAFGNAQLLCFAILGDARATHQLHHKVRTARLRGAAVEHARDIRMIHHRQGLTLGFETRHDLAGVHAPLDDLERHAASHRFLLFRCDAAWRSRSSRWAWTPARSRRVSKPSVKP